jgi:L-fucose dehydrogenase
MDLDLKNKVVIVSGGASGIGESISLSLSAEGAIPVIAGRENETAYKMKTDFEKEGKEAQFIFTELNPALNCKKIVDITLKNYGKIDALINNAGENDNIGLENGNPDAFLKSVYGNLLHYYALSYYALDALKNSKGSIVNISSKIAVTGQGCSSGYAAAKGAQLALTREWAVELLQYNIRVNAILPAEVMTPSYKKWLKKFQDPDKKLQSIINKVPLGKRFTTPDEIASMALFLISLRASHITGQFMFVDGGYVHLDRSLAGIENS